MQQYHSCTAQCSFRRRRGSVYFCQHGGGAHVCGAQCSLSPIETVEGAFCPWTGSQVHGAKCVQYANYLSKSPFAGKRQAVHWTSENIKRQKKARDSSVFLHAHKNVVAAMRLVFCSTERTKLKEQQLEKMVTFFRHAVKQRKEQMPFTTLCECAQRAAKKWPAVSCEKVSQQHDMFVVVENAILQYIAQHARQGLVIKNTKAFVAALLTLLAEGLVILGHEYIPKIDWVKKNIIPANYMTAVGIPCRAVSLAVRAVKVYMYGPNEQGIKDRAFTVDRHNQRPAQGRRSAPSEFRR